MIVHGLFQLFVYIINCTVIQYVSRLTIVQTRREKVIVCALLAWREESFKKSLLSQLGKMREKKYFAIYNRTIFQVNLFIPKIWEFI